MKLTVTALLIFAALAPASAQRTDVQAYRATFDYYTLRVRGEVTGRVRVSGTYTRDLRKKTATWTDVAVAGAEGMKAFEPAEQRPFMEGFSYPLNAPGMTSDTFFHGIPLTAMHERDLVFDARMFEIFGQEEFDHLKLNTPHHFEGNGPIELAGAGSFTNKDAVLTLTGTVMRNRQKCAIVDFRAFFNDVHLKLPGFALDGRSHYWGQIWVTVPKNDIEYATLYEDVLAEVAQPNGPPQPVNVFRIGTLERTDLH
jgi:hypothetical protein